ncbi:E6 protein [Human papillomavirus type 220]|uniref:Protein E6 n=1 Tax=Human papillomavirus type 220 TaxID=2200957 RepID=A0A2S1ZRW4_9PAPI|nr:E6 protein [Human papillomavirus type 220]
MAELFPVRVDDYCRTFNISFFDLRLRCIFCNFYLTVRELAEFYEKQLSLVWRRFECYACCERCIGLSAKYEREKYFQCAIKPTNIVTVCNRPLREIVVRCFYCFMLLDADEKLDHISRDKSFLLVRDHWRGYCRRCMRKQ